MKNILIIFFCKRISESLYKKKSLFIFVLYQELLILDNCFPNLELKLNFTHAILGENLFCAYQMTSENYFLF